MKSETRIINNCIDLLAQAIAKMKSYGILEQPGLKLHRIGQMSDAQWKNFFDTMVSEKLYSATLDYKKAYTLAFVQGLINDGKDVGRGPTRVDDDTCPDNH